MSRIPPQTRLFQPDLLAFCPRKGSLATWRSIGLNVRNLVPSPWRRGDIHL
jgi:hypothetical protein